jgi:hypothetical protein
MQTAYATGYTSWLMGQLILFRELECRALDYRLLKVGVLKPGGAASRGKNLNVLPIDVTSCGHARIGRQSVAHFPQL